MERESPLHSRIQNRDLIYTPKQPPGLLLQAVMERVDDWGLEITVVLWLEERDCCFGWKLVQSRRDSRQLQGLPGEEQANANSSSQINGHK